MIDTVSRLTAELRDAQRREWDHDEARRAAERSRCPDAQWDGPALVPPADAYDPSPAEQQAWAEDYRAAHPSADQRDLRGVSELSVALYDWRRAQASLSWQRAASWWQRPPSCQVCGADGEVVHLHGQRLVVCFPCRTALTAAVARHAGAEAVAGGRSRDQACDALAASLHATGSA